MKQALNLSSRSIVHGWSTAGIGGIPGYSYYVGNAAKAARFLKVGGYIGIGFAFAGTTNDVVNACAIGIVTAGAGGVACAVIGSVAGGYIGSMAGEKTVDFLLGSTGD